MICVDPPPKSRMPTVFFVLEYKWPLKKTIKLGLETWNKGIIVFFLNLLIDIYLFLLQPSVRVTHVYGGKTPPWTRAQHCVENKYDAATSV